MRRYRGSNVNTVSYTYSGKEYEIGLHPQTGKPYCADLDVQADTLDDVKKGIREKVAKRSALPKVNVWVDSDRYGSNRGKLTKATSTLHADGHNGRYIWVTRTDGQREKMYAPNVYPQNEKNDALVSQYNELWAQIRRLEKTAEDVMGKMEEAVPLDDDGAPLPD